MALAEKYVILFQKECSELSKIVLKNLEILSDDPKNSEALEKMLQAADTIIGDSRFINHKNLEEASMHLVKSFEEVDQAIGKTKEIEYFKMIFSKLSSE